MFMALPMFTRTAMADRRTTRDRRASGRELQDFVATLAKTEATIECSPDGRILYANDKFLGLLGLTLDDLNGQTHGTLVSAATRQSAEYRQLWEKLGRGEADCCEMKHIGKAGRELWLRTNFRPLLEADGKPYKVVAHATDITVLKMQATARITALHALRANVMIADNELNIAYMNPAVVTLMQEAEADLRKELPGFSVANLIGANIDSFHKNPSHQRKMLATLDRPHAASIKVGSRVFDLLVSPLIEKGERLGFVVEWTDARDRLLNLDYAAYFAAIGTSQAVIEFTIDGRIVTANANFLGAVGYTLDEVRGQHHSLFVDPAYRQSNEYRMFWEKLGRGEYDAGQYKRIAKGGREVWLQASYNPIYDANGKPAKVVKYATDITAQVHNAELLRLAVEQI
jgi:PAS domain S-box-containing protein